MPRFVIQKHEASRLHYDFRLELDGVLKSWAVPKEPPAEEGVKRLAVMVEDHDMDYIDFEGEIPEGQYGAGKVEIWDRGDYELENYKPGSKIDFVLNGEKLSGRYSLLRMEDKSEDQWLLMKTKEKE